LDLLPADALAGGWPATFTLMGSGLAFLLIFIAAARLVQHDELSRIIEALVRKRR
jgi:hypothetical protein